MGRLSFRYTTIGKTNTPSEHEAETIQGSARRSSRSWRAVIIMIIAFLSSILFALSQHLMNSYLNGRDVDSVGISSSWVSRLNTALAFLFKTCVVTTIGVAFIQRQWLKLHEESLRIGDIDALTGVLGNIFHFFGTSVWFYHPLLALMALCAWITPIATVITPGSIIVEQSSLTNTTNLQVPQHDWVAKSYVTTPCCGAYGTLFATPQALRIAYTSAMTGSSISLPSQYSNQSYNLIFYGPAVQCDIANDTVRDEIADFLKPNTGGVSLRYMSWVPADAGKIGLGSSEASRNGSSARWEIKFSTLDGGRDGPSKIFTLSQGGVTECTLYNASYDVDFIFAYPEQRHKISSVKMLNGIKGGNFIGPDGINVTGRTIASYGGVMDTFGNLLVGSHATDQYGDATTIQTKYNLLSVNWNTTESISRGLESLFQNITLSFLSDSAFTKNSTTASFVPVVATFLPVKYSYTPWELWLACGLSCSVGLISLLIGIQAFLQNGASYQNIFSTFVRVTSQHDELRRQVHLEDRYDDPIPKGLEETRIRLREPEQYTI